MDKFAEKPWMVTLAYTLLMIVMGGRTALFVAQFDVLLRFGDLTAFAILLAVALAIAVPAGSYYRARASKGTSTRKIGAWVMFGAAFIDGAFNISEAIILANDANVFADFTGFTRLWLEFTLLLVGIGPTLLTVGLASLAGSVERTHVHSTNTVRTKTKLAVAFERTTENNPSLDAHLTKVVAQLTPGQEFTRDQVEQWTGKSKQHAVNIVNYARARGAFGDVRRGVYIYRGETVDNG